MLWTQSRGPGGHAERHASRVRSLALGVCALMTSGCAATTYAHQTGDNRVGGAFEQPFQDTGWTRENPPEILIRAAEAPYALPDNQDCRAINDEISALDLVLGPDVDAIDEHEGESSTDASGLLSGAIRGLIGLPYRSIVRRFSGAEQRERVLREAILAGMVRRAFLKGVAETAACETQQTNDATDPAQQPQTPPPETPEAPPA